MPFAVRVREAWLSGWKNQKRSQSDHVLTFIRLHTDDGLTAIGESKRPRAETESRLKTMMGRPAQDFLHDESRRAILIAKLLSPAARRSITPSWWSQCFPPALIASEVRLGASPGFR